ncbi:MAG: polymer-forming cytoskeletal protein [Myxococcota bacterium]
MSKTFIGPSLTVEGDVEGEDELVIAGTVRGARVQGKEVLVEKGGQVEASVEADSLRVSGRVQGNANARARVELAAEGQMEGDVRAPRVVLADGARFKGHIETGIE